MAISGVNDSTREHEMYHRRLRELAEKNSKEVQELQKHQSQNIDELQKQQTRNLTELREKSEQQLKDQATEQQRQSQRLADRFEKQSFYDSKKAYDRFGRAQEDFYRQTKDIQDAHKAQVESVRTAADRTVDNQRRSHDEELNRIRRSNENVYFKTNNEADDKLNKQAAQFSNQAIEMTRKFQEDAHNKEYENFRNLSGAKSQANQRLEQLNNQRDNEVQNLRNAFSLREQQLVDEKNLRETKMAQSGADSLREYQQRLTDNVQKLVAENNYENVKKQAEFSNSLSQQTHEHRSKEQLQKMGLERALAEAQTRSNAEKDRTRLQNEVTRRRMIHEGHLENEMTKKRYEDSIAAMKSDQSIALNEQQERAQVNFDKIRKDMGERLTKMEKDRYIDDRAREMKNLDSSTSENARHAAERTRITAAYEAKQRELERKTHQSLDDQSKYFYEEKTKVRKDKEDAIATNSIENMDKMYKQRMRYETINELQSREFKEKVNTLDMQNTKRAENTRRNYNMTLEDLEKVYQTQMEELRREDALLLAKVRADLDAKLKNQQFDSDFKFKSMAQEYENRILEMQQDHERAMNSIKTDMTRMQRAMEKRHKDELEALMETNRKALALQESQFKEKTRLNEENHKGEIARLRHSNELLRQKS